MERRAENRKKDDNHSYRRIIIAIIAIYIIIAFILPFIFKFTIFDGSSVARTGGNSAVVENNRESTTKADVDHTTITVPSPLTNNEWAGFLGSYVGGILGGLGTLIAVYITVKSSQDIQEKDKKDADDRLATQNRAHQKEFAEHRKEIEDEIKRRNKERQEDYEESRRSERKAFVNDVAKELGVYITHISNYEYSGRESFRLEMKRSDARYELQMKKNKLHTAEDKLKELNDKKCSDSDNESEYKSAKDARDIAHREYNTAVDEYNKAVEAYTRNSEFGNRLKANEAYFTLHAMLGGIDEAKEFLTKLEAIHTSAGGEHEDESRYGAWIEEKSDEVMAAYAEFVRKYVV